MAAKFISERNLKFLFYDVFDGPALTAYPYFEQHNKKIFDMILDATLKLARDIAQPTLREMDQHPPQLIEGQVRVHPAVRKFMLECGRGGWIAAGFPNELQGEQLPHMLNAICQFIFAAANYSISVYPGLTAGAAALIATFGTPALIETYVPSMLAGKWQGTMALTEPQAGSSLTDIISEAHPTDQGHYRISGQKIFISGGDHDGADNVIHLLLAKIPGGPPGVKGISLFVVPKLRPAEDGRLIPNDVTVSQIYHKLGYRGCPITELCFGEKQDCRGFLVGEPHKGLSYMFQMMNGARIEVGLGATAIAQAAYLAALDYARLRPQGRRLTEKDPARPQVPIIEHADVKRMLLFQKAVVEGALSLIIQCALYADRGHVTKGEDKENAGLLLDLLTPVVKTYPAEMGLLSVSSALQCLGGYGYCQDFPLEQYYRDIRIHPIHEGTTGIQGMDLLGRKVIMQNGRAMKLYLQEVHKTTAAARTSASLEMTAGQMEAAAEKLTGVTTDLISRAQARGAEIFLADATVYLEMFGIVTIAWQWLKQAVKAQALLDEQGSRPPRERNFYRSKLMTCRFFFKYEVPKINALADTLLDEEPLTVQMSANFFDD
jgi:alkylation response protein AidB-like acyl-CoA dehydrogenase